MPKHGALPLAQLYLIYLIDLICHSVEAEHVNKAGLLNSILQRLVSLDVLSGDVCNNKAMLDIGKAVGERLTSSILSVITEVQNKERRQLGNSTADVLIQALSRASMKRSGSSSHLFPTFEDYVCSTSVQASRYRREFTEGALLGKGGFGCVVQARNNIDGQDYAIKKIPVSTVSDLSDMKIIREVRCLAKIDHPNVVRYYSAWFEISSVPVATAQADGESASALEDSESDLEEDELPFCMEDEASVTLSEGDDWKREFESGNVFRSSALDGWILTGQQTDQLELLQQSTREHDNSSQEDSQQLSDYVCFEGQEETAVSPPPVPSLGMAHKFIVLYIQMELCPHGTLQDYLTARMSAPHVGTSGVNYVECLQIFHQIVCGLRHIHALSIVHRDVKPRNIFLSRPDPTTPGRVEYPGNYRVMLGDFGLALQLSQNTHKEQEEGSANESSDDVPTPASSFSSSMAGSPHRTMSEGHLPDLLNPSVSSPRAASSYLLQCNQRLPRDLCPPVEQRPRGYSEAAHLPAFDPTYQATGSLPPRMEVARPAKLVIQTPQALPYEVVANDDERTRGVGTSVYSSPEQLVGLTYGTASDMYSLGVVLYELLYPFRTSMERVEALKKLRKTGRCDRLFRHMYPQVAVLIKTLLSRDPDLRPSCDTLLQDSLFTSIPDLQHPGTPRSQTPLSGSFRLGLQHKRTPSGSSLPSPADVVKSVEHKPKEKEKTSKAKHVRTASSDDKLRAALYRDRLYENLQVDA